MYKFTFPNSFATIKRCVTNDSFFALTSLVPRLIARPASQVSLWLRHSLPHCRSQPLYFFQTLCRYRATPSLLPFFKFANAQRLLTSSQTLLLVFNQETLFSLRSKWLISKTFFRKEGRQSLPNIGYGVKSRSLLPSPLATVKQYL